MIFDYAEYGDNGGLLDYEYGVLPGVTADISRTQQGWFVAGKMSYYAGDVLYDGQTQTRVPVTTDTNENIQDLFLQVGHQHRSIDHFGYALYAGVGLHRWDRDIRSTQTVSGLTEFYHWEYAALGAKVISRETNRATWALNLRWQHVLHPLLDINFRGTYDSLQLALGDRDGIYFSVPWTKRLNERWQFIIEPYYERWVLGRSANQALTSQGTVVGTVFEPRSVTNNRGVIASVGRMF